MRTKIRKILTRFISYLQFRIDTTDYLFDKPRFDYQPLPWVGISEASIRGQATKDRWEAMKSHIQNSYKSLKDIGCCVGFFCLKGSEELGLYTFGYDNNEKHIRLGRFATPAQLKYKTNFLLYNVDQESVRHIAETDITLCLSIWHHWFYEHGMEGATSILQTLWDKTHKVLFFESGEEEVKEEMNLPFTDNKPAREWLETYLKDVLPNSKVTPIGTFQAGNYKHYTKSVARTVFKIERV